MVSRADSPSRSLSLGVHIHLVQGRVVAQPVDLVVIKHEALTIVLTERTAERHLGVALSVLSNPGLAVRLQVLILLLFKTKRVLG